MTTTVRQQLKPLNPNAVPFWSPSSNRRSFPLSKQTPQTKALDAQAAPYIDPATELEEDTVKDLMEEFIMENEMAAEVVSLGMAEQDEADEALTEAQDAGLIPRSAPVTEAEIEGEGEEFVASNFMLECEEDVDPDADPREGLDEATAAMEHYGGAPLPTPTPSEIDEDGEMFVLENALAELEMEEPDDDDVDSDEDEATTALEQLDVECEFHEIDAEVALADAVRAYGRDEQAEADAAADEAEMEAAGEEFALEVALVEAELDDATSGDDDELVTVL
eukprot:m.34675 g.34675  ORF g.34675 m.34675 type:complete len:278 (-) comp5172_c0_seq1:100-933(-)